MPPSMQMFSPVIKPTLSLQSMTQNYSYISYRGIFKSKNMHSRQEKAAKPARNWIPPACRAGKRLISCAEGAPEAFEAGKGGKSCAELDTNRLLSRKAPQILRRRLQTASTSPPSTNIFLFLAILLFLRKIHRINLPYRFSKPFEIHRFARRNH